MFSEEQIISVDSLPREIINGATYVIKQANPNSYTHGMFKYPCKFIPEIPRWALKKYTCSQEAIIFDPFMGSGTTALEACINGYDAYGTEIDDIAKLITEVKTRRMSGGQLLRVQEESDKLREIVKNEYFPSYQPDINNIEHWFSGSVIGELGRVRAYIESIEDKIIRDFFLLCMVSIVKRVSYADDTSPKPYVSRRIIKTPPPVEKELFSVIDRYSCMVKDLNEIENFGKYSIVKGDALNFTVKEKISLAITSPPYINAFDYGRTMRLENLWAGAITEEGLREKKAFYVGTEKIRIGEEIENLEIIEMSKKLKYYYSEVSKIDSKRGLIIKKFFEDMKTNMEKVYRNLANGGRYVIVIGNSNIRKVEIESWKVIQEIGNEIGFETEIYFDYIIQNPYIRIPRMGKGGKISKDHALVLRKGE